MVLAGVSRAANADLLGPLAANVAIEPGGCLFALGGAGCPSRRRGKGSFSLVGIGHCPRLLSDSRQEMMQIHSFASDCSSIGLPVTCEYNTSGSKSAPFGQQMVPEEPADLRHGLPTIIIVPHPRVAAACFGRGGSPSSERLGRPYGSLR